MGFNNSDFSAKIIKRVIILIWILLSICLTTRFFGSNLFIINIDDLKLVNTINNIYKHSNLNKIIGGCIFNLILITPYFLSIYKKKWFDKKVDRNIFFILIIINNVSRVYLSPRTSLIIELVIFLVYPTVDLLINNKDAGNKWIRPVCAYLICGVYQLSILLIRKVAVEIYSPNNSLLNFVYFVDTAIIVYAYYFKSIKEIDGYGGNIFIIFKRTYNSVKGLLRNINGRKTKRRT